MFSETASIHSVSGVTSLTLLQRLKDRDPDGWVSFCRVYGPLVYGWARGKGLQSTDAADVAQDVFLVVAERILEFRRLRDRSFRNWLWTISHHVILAHYRKSRQLPIAVGGTSANQCLSHLLADDGMAEPESDAGERTGLVARVLQALRSEISESAWQAFWRTTVGGEPASDVAEDLGLSHWAVYKTKARMLHRVRLELSGLVPPDDILRVDDGGSLPRIAR